MKIKMFYIDNLLCNKHFIYMKILVKLHFSLRTSSYMNTGISFSLEKLHRLSFAWRIRILDETNLVALKILKNSVTI